MGVYNKNLSPDRFLLYAGRKLNNHEFPSPVVDFEITKARVLRFDCLSSSALVPIVNDKIKHLIESIAPDDVQFIPVKVVCTDGILSEYYYINVLNKVEGLDYKNSILKEMDGVITGIKHLEYKPDIMGNHELIREKHTATFLLISEKLKNILEKHKCTNIRFVPAQGYSEYGTL